MKHITKEFPGVRALADVNISISKGEIHVLCGENGAGKSTLMNILSGIHPYGSYSGEIIFDGNVCRFQSIKDSEKAGIVIIHQELELVPLMSIAENMFFGNERGASYKINWDETFAQADALLRKVGLDESPHTLIKDIGVGKQQFVEIAKALGKNAKLLILDEPTASLNDMEAQHLLDLLLELKANGMTLILISHKLNEISEVADTVTVIRDGNVTATFAKGKDEISEDTIIPAMIGRNFTDRFPKRTSKIGDVCFEVKDWCVDHPQFKDIRVCDHINFNLRRGEVIGISGLLGSGRTELAMSIFGHSYGTNISGQLFLNRREIHLPNVKSAIEHGIAYVTEDRKDSGLILSDSILKNITMANPEKISKYGVINFGKERMSAIKAAKEMHVKCISVNDSVEYLSGGNMQKVLLAKWLFADPNILILDEPTKGIDVGAKYEIYQTINKMVESGKSIILISSEMPEVLGLSDRIYIMNKGKIIAETPAHGMTQEKIMSYITDSENK